MDNQEAVQPKQPTSPTFQQQQINIINNNNSSSSNSNQFSPGTSGSPRRRKAPIDLDAALYLQSQAALVQEPNTTTTTSPATTSNSTLNTVGSSGNNNDNHIQSNLISNSNPNISPKQQPHANPLRVDNNINTIGNTTNTIKSQFKSSTSSFPANHGRYDDYNTSYNDCYHKTDGISVDYIDCVSNNDLTTTNNNRISTMRGIPHCKKHLRFHRNRVDPSTSTTSSNNIRNDSNSDNNTNTANRDSMRATSASNETSSTINSDEYNVDLQQQQEQHQNQSVLYPISIDDVKKRTYFADSLNQDSLLGPDELHRYFPSGRVNIFISTWNQNRKRAPMNLDDLLLPDQLINMPDIYAIAIQEAFSYQADYLKEWEIELQTTLGPNHVLLHSCSLGVLHLALFVRRDLIWFCSTPEESVYNSRSMPTNMIKTKGAVSIAFRFFGTSFMFTNCHFPAHEHRLKDRIDEYQKIIKSIDLPKDLKLLKPRYLSNDSTARFDCVFFLGDLNFRLEHRTFEETINIMDDIIQQQQKERCYEPLTQNDELIKVMESGQAFHGFDESPIKFPPTYKFLAQTNKYDKQSRRVPSYTDRILFRSKRRRHIQCLIYDWLPQLLSSDHKPVYCLFSVLIRPGSQLNNMVKSLNAGLFQRAVYLEALKRRTEDPDGCLLDKDATGGNVICSIT